MRSTIKKAISKSVQDLVKTGFGTSFKGESGITACWSMTGRGLMPTPVKKPPRRRSDPE
jgi:hypothetical protein